MRHDPTCEPDSVLEFWFGAQRGRAGTARAEWFRKDAGFDATIRQRFGKAIGAAIDGALDGWSGQGPEDSLALILVLDQFTRNAFRDTPAMFDGDTRALALAHGLVETGVDARLRPLQRWFAYLPFEHAESIAEQDLAVELFDALRAYPETADAYNWAVRHRDVVRRFGRFPHRNALLGRESTEAERAFLALPGSRF